MKLKDYDKLPYLNKYLQRDLIRVYAKLLSEFEVSKSPVIKAKKRVLVRIIDVILNIVSTSKDVEKIKTASLILRALMIDSSHEEFIWNVDFVETSDQKQLLTQLAVEVKKYNDKVKKQGERKQQTLLEQKVRIEQVLGVQIDVKKCSVAEYMVYSREAVSKINTHNKQVN